MPYRSRIRQRIGDVALSRRGAFTFPNLVTVARVALVPCFLYLVLQWLREGDVNAHLIAVACFVIIAFSDMLDGYLARRLGQTSTLGSLLDPTADFFFMTVSFVVLGTYGKVPMWLTIIVVSKCVVLSIGWALRYVVLSIVQPQPTLLGKWTTCLQFACVGLALLRVPAWLESTAWIATGLFNVVAVGDYLLAGLYQAQRPQEPEVGSANVVPLEPPGEQRREQ